MDVQYLLFSYRHDPRLFADEAISFQGFRQTEEGLRAIFATDPPDMTGYDPAVGGWVDYPEGGGVRVAYKPHREFWLDPERDYVATRILRSSVDGRKQADIRIEYAPDERIGWLPAELVYMRYGDGETVQQHTVRSVVAADANFPNDESLFTIDFPEGTTVTDHIRGVTYVVGQEGEEPVQMASAREPSEAEPAAQPAPDPEPKPVIDQARLAQGDVGHETQQPAATAVAVLPDTETAPAERSMLPIILALVACAAVAVFVLFRRARA